MSIVDNFSIKKRKIVMSDEDKLNPYDYEDNFNKELFNSNVVQFIQNFFEDTNDLNVIVLDSSLMRTTKKLLLNTSIKKSNIISIELEKDVSDKHIEFGINSFNGDMSDLKLLDVGSGSCR